MFAGYPVYVWIGFVLFILLLLALDLGVFHRKSREIPFREAMFMTAAYIALSLAFAGLVFYLEGPQAGLEFVTGYFLEKALSMDNIMIFAVILAHFKVPPEHQLRVLAWGIIGALIMRGIFIFAGLAILALFDWMILVFGALLIWTGVKSLLAKEHDIEIEDNVAVRLTQRVLPVTSKYDGRKFFTRLDNGVLKATPLFLVLVILNFVDIVFALDSIPAVFAVTRDPFIVFTSNIFAVLGLRAMYFALASLMPKFRYLKAGLSLTLVFVGFKMLFNYPEGWPDLPTLWALAVAAVLIFGSIALSIMRARLDEDNKAKARF